MARFDLSAHAEADLAAIATYTAEQWGKSQAIHYVEAVEACLSRLARQPLLGQLRDDLADGLRSFPAASHMIYFVPTDFGIAVVRILHQRQDPHRHIES